MNAIRNTVIFATCALVPFLATPARATDVAGNWYNNAGIQVITIYKAGPEYAPSISDPQGVVPGGTPNAPTGTYRKNVSGFSVAGNHVLFQINETIFAPGMNMATMSWEYDLNLSPEGQRLVGTLVTTIFNGSPTTSNVTLFLRN
jgi:hypothetical protein